MSNLSKNLLKEFLSSELCLLQSGKQQFVLITLSLCKYKENW